jgi:SAM-dependent methyltransferase
MSGFTSDDRRISIIEQYSNALYSDFVEAHENVKMFTEYHHYTFFKVMSPIIKDADENFRLLDIGCGNGIMGRKCCAMNENISVVGVDLSPAMLARARQHSLPADRFRYIEANACHLPADLGHFQAIVSGYFFAHLESRFDLFKVFKNIADHLAPGGITCNLVPGSPHGLKEGEIVPVTLVAPGGDIKLYDTFWSLHTYMEAAFAAGLVDVQIRPCEMSAAGKQAHLDASMFSSFVIVAHKPL